MSNHKMSFFFKMGIFLILILGIVLFNRASFKPLIEGHGGGGGGGGRGVGFGGVGRGVGIGGRGIGLARRGIGYGALGYGAYRGYYGGYGDYYDNNENNYYYSPPVYEEYSYDVYGNPILVRPNTYYF